MELTFVPSQMRCTACLSMLYTIDPSTDAEKMRLVCWRTGCERIGKRMEVTLPTIRAREID